MHKNLLSFILWYSINNKVFFYVMPKKIIVNQIRKQFIGSVNSIIYYSVVLNLIVNLIIFNSNVMYTRSAKI